jgi:3-oxoacyl-[acyl-carrier protein] reductase
MDLNNRVAVITGAAGRIGRAIAERFLNANARVALLDVNYNALTHVAQELTIRGIPESRWIVVKTDVCDPDSLTEAFATVDRELGLCDVAVANAGVAQAAPFLDLTLANWKRTLDINLTGVFLTCQAAAQRMKLKGAGSLITMSSTNGLAGERELAAYNASKAGVLLLTKTIAIELAPFHVRANALNPGMIDTGLAERSGLDSSFLDRYVDKIPMGRLGLPDEVASAALFLASDASQFITGTALVIDGGQLAEE